MGTKQHTRPLSLQAKMRSWLAGILGVVGVSYTHLPYNAHAERRQGIAHPQHQQKFAKEEHCVHSQRADEQIA